MKKLLLTILLLCLASGASAKSLTNGSELAPATDSVYTSVLKVDAQLTRIFGYLNTLFKLQAAASAPTGNATYDVWIDTSGAEPALKYYDGDTWEPLVASPAYASGLTFADSAKGYRQNCTLEHDTTTTTVMVNATAALPCTIEVGDVQLQVASKLSYEFALVSAGTYYVKAVRTGSTTAFTLDYDAEIDTSEHYLGEVRIGAAGVVDYVVSYDSYEHQRTQPVLGLFGAYQANGTAIAATHTKLDYGTLLLDTNTGIFNVGTDILTPTRRGWYEVHAKSTVNAATITQHCIALVKNGTTTTQIINSNCTDGIWVDTEAYVYFNGSTDYLLVMGFVTPSGATATTTAGNEYMNAVWGRWIGEKP